MKSAHVEQFILKTLLTVEVQDVAALNELRAAFRTALQAASGFTLKDADAVVAVEDRLIGAFPNHLREGPIVSSLRAAFLQDVFPVSYLTLPSSAPAARGFTIDFQFRELKSEEIPVRLKRLRKQLGLKQQDFVSAFNDFLIQRGCDKSYDASTLSKWENGRIPLPKKVIEWLDLFVESLVQKSPKIGPAELA